MEHIRYKIALVDDNMATLNQGKNLLQAFYKVYTIQSASTLFEYLQNDIPDMILLDVEMPEMDGLEVIKKLKADYRYKDIPVMFLTSKSDEESEKEGFRLGAMDFITKPFSEMVLLRRIKHHLHIDTLIKERTEQANAAIKAKSDFLSNMNHEMRTPLNAIIGMTNIGKQAKNRAEVDRALNIIGDASSHLLDIISDVLDMAKIETNKLELAPVEFSFERMLQKAMAVVGFRMDEKQQIFTVNVDKNIPRFIVGDEQRLTQVIVNLMSNATKFTPAGGRIFLEASLIGEPNDNCNLRIEVADSGIGISGEQQEKLFKPFVQVESGANRKYSGTGLGLIISKRIVELMEGRIWIESELGKGSKFIFTVKMRRGKKDLDSTKEHSGAVSDKDIQDTISEFAGKKLLLVDDVEINRIILITLLENTGLEIDCAENGSEALETIKSAPDKYDIVFMDVQMPEMDGHESTRRIRALGYSRRCPIVAMTANVSKEDIEACLAAGMDNHLGKPLDIDRVLEILRKYLG